MQAVTRVRHHDAVYKSDSR